MQLVPGHERSEKTAGPLGAMSRPCQDGR
ncbi:unnamed protein product [Gulo gulo]|uniref:Uncharacterized protein n=1 Tax=Gulo gulo TaxID=48420 RepID=A0A9X9LYA1_GULGU|nr:unnamed protein product [Gulo gulo]